MNETGEERKVRMIETAAAAGLILLRLIHGPVQDLWRDGLTVLGAYWIFCIWGRGHRSWPAVTGLVAVYLAAVYLTGQLHHTMFDFSLAFSGSP